MLHFLAAVTLVVYLAILLDASFTAVRSRNSFKPRTRLMALTAVVAHTSALIVLIWQDGMFLLEGSGDYYFLLSWALSVFGLPLYTRLTHPVFLALISGCCALLIAGSSYLVHFQLTPSGYTGSYFLLLMVFHIAPAILAQVALLMSCAASVLLLIQERRLKAKRFDLLDTIPALSIKRLSTVRSRLVLAGFALISIAIVSGAVWLWYTGAAWGYDPLRFLALAAWLCLGMLLQMQLCPHYSSISLAKYTVLIAGLYITASLLVLASKGGAHAL